MKVKRKVFLKYGVLVFVLVFLFCLVINIWEYEKNSSSRLMQNGIFFTGTITDFTESNNHSFGIIKIKLMKSNKKHFVNSDVIYPYQINDSVAEIYHTISYKLHKGMIAKVYSNAGIVSFFESDSLIYDSEITIISDANDISYIERNAQIK